jgi:hypothetical protein
MERIDPAKRFRFGLITPYLRRAARRRAGVTRDPREVTKWRNEPLAKRRESPVVVLGNASGRDESGLRKVPTVIRASTMLDVYQDMLLAYLTSAVQSNNPPALCKALLGMARESLIDVAELDAFFQETLRNARTSVSEPQAQLWRLRLIPDPRAMDENPGARLSRNYQTVELLRNQADTIVEEKQLDRIDQAADAGDPVAIQALKFRGSGRKEDLKALELDSLLALMSSRGPRPDPPSRGDVSFFEALDQQLLSA